MHAVVTDQYGGGNLPGSPGQDEIEGEARFAGPGGPADQHGVRSHQHCRSVDARVHSAAHGAGAGSRSTKRAPDTVASPSALVGPGRFSAQMRPPWASMICLEIDSPSPEFCPKP